MKPGYYKSPKEYQISKQLLMAFIRSKEALQAWCGTNPIIQHTLSFIQEHIVIYDNQFLFYTWKSKQNFGIANNSAHEGINHGLKSHAASVLPSQKILTAAKAMTF